MKAKIIADIAIMISAGLFFTWWLESVPFPEVQFYPFLFGHEQTQSQALSINITILLVLGSVGFITLKIIEWIHK